MIKTFHVYLTYLIIFFNISLFAQEKDNLLKIGLLAPLSGKYEKIGSSILFATQMALNEIDDKNIIIIPRDSGFNDKKKIDKAIKDIKSFDVEIIIGPISYNDFDVANKYPDTIFVSPSNYSSEFKGNVVSVGINLESQLKAIEKLLKKEKKTKTLLLYPEDQNVDFIEKSLKNLDFNFNKIFKYTPDQEILTGQLEKITNYERRKRNLKIRKKVLEKKDDLASQRELELLEQKYTLGKVNFDSVVILDFGNSLKSVISTLIFQDVDQNNVLFATLNQWFDKSLFFENSLKKLYFPSVNLKNFNKFKIKYRENFSSEPNEITILAYDAIGLVYYLWKTGKKSISLNNFNLDKRIKGKIGYFKFKKQKTLQDLNMYVTDNGKFKKY